MIIQKSKLENQINLNDTRQGLTVLTSTRCRKYMFNKQKIQKKQKSESSSITEKYTETNTIKPK